MWDLHHCKNAVKREAEFAPRMNEVLEVAHRRRIHHSCAERLHESLRRPPGTRTCESRTAGGALPDKISEWCRAIPAEEKVKYPLDQTDGGEDDDPAEHAAWARELEAKGLNPRAPWTRQIDVLRIDANKDTISDSGVEVWNLLEACGVKNVILMGG